MDYDKFSCCFGAVDALFGIRPAQFYGNDDTLEHRAASRAKQLRPPVSHCTISSTEPGIPENRQLPPPQMGGLSSFQW